MTDDFLSQEPPRWAAACWRSASGRFVIEQGFRGSFALFEKVEGGSRLVWTFTTLQAAKTYASKHF